jgi:DNA-binding MarR family transcriptional regulator
MELHQEIFVYQVGCYRHAIVRTLQREIGTIMSAVVSPRVVYIVKQLELAVRARLDQICREYGVTIAQYTALSVVRVRPGISSAQLAVRSFITPQSAHQTVSELERTGLITRIPDELNRRILRNHLTAKGLLLLESCDGAVDELEHQMFEGLHDDEQSQLQALLGRCIRNLSV